MADAVALMGQEASIEYVVVMEARLLEQMAKATFG
jgi:hypothetical protein